MSNCYPAFLHVYFYFLYNPKGADILFIGPLTAPIHVSWSPTALGFGSLWGDKWNMRSPNGVFPMPVSRGLEGCSKIFNSCEWKSQDVAKMFKVEHDEMPIAMIVCPRAFSNCKSHSRAPCSLKICFQEAKGIKGDHMRLISPSLVILYGFLWHWQRKHHQRFLDPRGLHMYGRDMLLGSKPFRGWVWKWWVSPQVGVSWKHQLPRK